MRNLARLSWTRSFIHHFRTIPIGIIALYQMWVSPFIFPSCRFHPSCSTYARRAIEKYGIFKGGILALIRLLKCHPFHPGGYDPLR